MIRAHVTGKKLLLAWLGLLALTFISFGASRLAHGSVEMLVALGISVVKTLVVLFIFMHLIEQRFANRLIVILTLLFTLLMVSLTMADPLTRKTYPMRPDPAARPYD